MASHPARNRGAALSIRSALFLAVLFAIAPALGLIIWSGHEHGHHLENQAIAEIQRQTDAFAEIQVVATESTRQILATIAALQPFQAGEIGPATDILKAIHARNGNFLNFTFVDTAGTVLASSLLPSGTDLSKRSHVVGALSSKAFTVGQYNLGVIEATPSLGFSHPVFDGSGRLVGVVNAIFRLSSYAALLDRFSPPGDAIFGVVDRNGVRLYFYPAKATNPIGASIKTSVWEQISNGRDGGIFFDQGSDGIGRFYCFRALRLDPLQEPYLYVVYASPVTASSEASRRVMFRNIVLMIVVALFAFFASAAIFGGVYGSRLRRIIDVADALRAGNLTARVGAEEGHSELGRIGVAIDLMAETIERRDSERAENAKQLEAALADKEVLLKEVHHRVKNNLQLVQSMILLQDDGSDFASFKEAICSRISAMSLLHETLYRTKNEGESNLTDYAARIAELVIGNERDRIDLRVPVPAEPVQTNLEKAIPFGLLVNELVTNSLKHGFPDGRRGTLTVAVSRVGGRIRLEVSDDGRGLPADFRIGDSGGLGLVLAEALSAQIGGQLRWETAGGARFYVEFPSGIVLGGA
jgi:two-component sensor histidine kinase